MMPWEVDERIGKRMGGFTCGTIFVFMVIFANLVVVTKALDMIQPGVVRLAAAAVWVQIVAGP